MKFPKLVTSIPALLLCPAMTCLAQVPKPKNLGPNGIPLPIRADDLNLGHGYVRRDGAIHFIARGRTGVGPDRTRIDAPAPDILKGFRDAGVGPFQTAEGLDVESFEALSEKYTRDKNHVYSKVISPGVFLVIQLPQADPATFEVLAPTLGRDQNHVWLHERIQPGVDPDTVEIVNGGFAVFKDKDSVHYQNTKVAGADPASFRHLDSGYYVDQNRVYWGSEAVPGADAATFEVLGNSFIAKDKKQAYRSGQAMPEIDAASLALIVHDKVGFQIYSDRNGIHVNRMTFPRSQPGEVKVIDNLTVQAGDLVLLVEPSWSVPITVFKADGQLMAETPAYHHASRKVQGTITAKVTAEGLKDIRIRPLLGGTKAPPVPRWQIEVFKNARNVKRMIEVGKLIQ